MDLEADKAERATVEPRFRRWRARGSHSPLSKAGGRGTRREYHGDRCLEQQRAPAATRRDLAAGGSGGDLGGRRGKSTAISRSGANLHNAFQNRGSFAKFTTLGVVLIITIRSFSKKNDDRYSYLNGIFEKKNEQNFYICVLSYRKESAEE